MFQTRELRSYLKEQGAEISEENSGDGIKDLIQCIDASEVCWKEVSADAGMCSEIIDNFLNMYDDVVINAYIICSYAVAA